MKLTFHLEPEAIYDCTLHIRDAKGTRAYHMTPHATAGTVVMDTVTVSAEGDFVEVAVFPKICEALGEELRRFRGDNLLETVAVKAVGKAVAAFYRAVFLHVAVTYRIPLGERLGAEAGVDDAIHLRLTERGYCPTPEWMIDWLDIHPLSYVFHELGEGDRVYTPVDARDINGREVIRHARRMIFAGCAAGGILLYPFIMSHAKRLTRSRVILRKLKKLYSLPPEERERQFGEQEGAVIEKI